MFSECVFVISACWPSSSHGCFAIDISGARVSSLAVRVLGQEPSFYVLFVQTLAQWSLDPRQAPQHHPLNTVQLLVLFIRWWWWWWKGVTVILLLLQIHLLSEVLRQVDVIFPCGQWWSYEGAPAAFRGKCDASSALKSDLALHSLLKFPSP